MLTTTAVSPAPATGAPRRNMRPAAAGRARLPAHAADMHADRKYRAQRLLVHRPASSAGGGPTAHRCAAAEAPARSRDWPHSARFRQWLLPDAGRTMIEPRSRSSFANHSAACQSFMARANAAPYSTLRWLPAPARRGTRTPIVDPIGIEVLLAHEVEIGAGRPAVRRPGVASRYIRRHARIGKRLGQCLPDVATG